MIGYARCSTDEQTVTQQDEALRAAGCSKVYADEGVSGTTTSRPELDRCLDALQRGDVLCVVRLDRLGRSMAHLVTTVEALAQRGVGFRSLHEAIDTKGPAGRLVLHMFAALSQFERDIISERTKEKMASKRRRGERIGRPLALTPSQVRAAKKMLDQGEGPSQVARVLRVDRSTLYRALQRSA